MNKNKKISLIAVISLVGILLITGISYAVFNYETKGETKELIAGDIWMKYTENNQLVLEDAMPMDINKHIEYKVNPVMANQEVVDNELTRCVNYLEGTEMPLSNGTMEEFCKGEGTAENNFTFQENLYNGDWFWEELITEMLSLNIIIKDGENYFVNSSMATQEVNQLTRCVYILGQWGWNFNPEYGAEGFCKGYSTIYGGNTFQDEIDEWIIRSESESTFEEGFLIAGGQELLDAGVIIRTITNSNKIKIYKVKVNMSEKELNSCIDIYTNWDYEFDEGSDAESYCKGEGTAWGGYTIQDDIDDWSWYNHYFLMEGGIELLDAGIITEEIIEEKKYIVNPNITEEVINKCVTILRDEFDWGKNDDETWEDYCKGTGTIYEETFQENLNETGYFYLSELNKLEENSIIVVEKEDKSPYFEFTISGKNTYTKKDIFYEIMLTHGDEHETRTTRIRDDLLRFSLVEIKEGKETIVIHNQKYNDLKNRRIWVNTIPKNINEEVNITYRLYMLVDESTVIGNIDEDYTLEEWDDVFASVKVNVKGNFSEKQLSYEEKYNVTDEGCFTVRDKYRINQNMTEEELEICKNYFAEANFRDYLTVEDFCKGYGLIFVDVDNIFENFQEYIDYNSTVEDVNYLEENNIIKYDGLSIVNYDSDCGGVDVVIPQKIENKIISSIDEYAFADRGLTSVIVSPTIENIDYGAFLDNYIETVDIPDSVNNYYCGSFDYMTSNQTKLVKINHREDLVCKTPEICFTTEPENDFYIINDEMSTTDFNKCITYFEDIGYQAILKNGETLDSFCKGTGTVNGETFQEILYDKKLTEEDFNYLSTNNIIKFGVGIIYYNYHGFNDDVCSYPIVSIPSHLDGEPVASIKRYGYGPFSGRNVWEINFPDNIIKIGGLSFLGSHIHDLKIPSSVIEIGRGAFGDPELLNTFNNLIEIELEGNTKYIGANAFGSFNGSSLSYKIKFKTKTCDEIRNIGGYGSDNYDYYDKYYPWLSYDLPYYTEEKFSVYGTDGLC